MPFTNPIVAGEDLVRPSIRSPDYVPGISGWAIFRDGSAEFNDITARGLIESSRIKIGPSGAGEPDLIVDADDPLANYYFVAVGISLYSEGEESNRGFALITDTPDTDKGEVYLFSKDLDTLDDDGQYLHCLHNYATNSRVVTLGFKVDTINIGNTALTPDPTINLNGDVAFGSANSWTAYTPTVTGGGTVTWTTIAGRWRRTGVKTVEFNAFFHVNAAGSGATNVSFTTPTDIHRTVRQTFPGDSETPTRNMQAICFTGGSGATVDRIREFDATVNRNMTGADLTAGRLITISGRYEEA